MKRHRRRLSPKPRTSSAALERLHPDAAGIDCGSAEHFVAVPPDRDTTPVRAFATFTGALNRLADWLTTCRVTHVAMEATGVYWIPVFEILEARGFHVILVNARHVKIFPAAKVTSPIASGSATCISSGCCVAASARRMRSSHCAGIFVTARRSSNPPVRSCSASRRRSFK
jgi:transposase